MGGWFQRETVGGYLFRDQDVSMHRHCGTGQPLLTQMQEIQLTKEESPATFIEESRTELANGNVFQAVRVCDTAQTNERLAYYANLAFVRDVEARKAHVQNVLRDMDYHHAGWTWLHTDNAIALFSQHESKSLVYDGIATAPLFELMFLLSEVHVLETSFRALLCVSVTCMFGSRICTRRGCRTYWTATS